MALTQTSRGEGEERRREERPSLPACQGCSAEQTTVGDLSSHVSANYLLRVCREHVSHLTCACVLFSSFAGRVISSLQLIRRAGDCIYKTL